jgi:hypothetical protein
MRTIKSFITRDDYINNDPLAISDVFELSDYANTYAKDKKSFYYSQNSLYSLKVFNHSAPIDQGDADMISSFIAHYTNFATTNLSMDEYNLLQSTVASFNSLNAGVQVSQLSTIRVVSYQGLRTAEYFYFVINNDIEALVWTSDRVFKLVYPDYIIDTVFPSTNFASIVTSPANFITMLDNFDFAEFTDRVNVAKGMYPPTHSRVLKVPYKVPNTTIFKNCYFAFNIYNEEGNYDDLLKLELFEYLISNTSLTQTDVENIFPSLLNINEFFIVPRWDKIALPSQIGQTGVYSQVQLAFNETFDLDKYVTVYPEDHLRTQTYSVPIEYNNMLLNVCNGYYSQIEKRDFKVVYGDIITVSTTETDFSRMSTVTQNFLTKLYDLLNIANSNSFLELFNKIFSNDLINVYKLRTRNGISYVTVRYNDHLYYVLSKYEFERLQ